jgi:hypothetical protein
MPKKPPAQRPIPPGGELLLYQAEDGKTRVQCRFDEGTLWLTQAQIAELFQTTPQNVTIHLKTIFAEGELREAATCKEYLQVRQEGARSVSRQLRHYHLEAVLAVGYRVRSPRGTQFRQWATARLEEYLRKGFTMDDERLKHPPGPRVPDYFDELRTAHLEEPLSRLGIPRSFPFPWDDPFADHPWDIHPRARSVADRLWNRPGGASIPQGCQTVAGVSQPPGCGSAERSTPPGAQSNPARERRHHTPPPATGSQPSERPPNPSITNHGNPAGSESRPDGEESPTPSTRSRSPRQFCPLSVSPWFTRGLLLSHHREAFADNDSPEKRPSTSPAPHLPVRSGEVRVPVPEVARPTRQP